MNLLRNAAVALTVLLAGAVFAHAEDINWLTDHAAAVKASQEQKKPLFLFFTGSDWCGWCKKLVAEVLTKDEFKAYASKNLIMLEVDFPRGKSQSREVKAQNQKLQDQYQIEGYPTVVLLDPAGTQKGGMGYMPGGPKAFIAEVEKVLK